MLKFNSVTNRHSMVILCFLISLFFFQLGIQEALLGTQLEDSDDMTVEQALDQKRLIQINKNPKFQGTGGPTIPLPDGSIITRDTIFEAIQPLIKQGQSICPALVKALKSEKTHIRYGAYLALKLITKSEKAYYPLFPPTDPKNLKAYQEWENFVRTLVNRE